MAEGVFDRLVQDIEDREAYERLSKMTDQEVLHALEFMCPARRKRILGMLNERPDWVDHYDLDGPAPKTDDREVLVEASRMEGSYDLEDELREKEVVIWQDLKEWMQEQNHSIHTDEVERELYNLGFAPANSGKRFKLGVQGTSTDYRVWATLWTKNSYPRLTSDIVKKMRKDRHISPLTANWSNRMMNAFNDSPM